MCVAGSWASDATTCMQCPKTGARCENGVLFPKPGFWTPAMTNRTDTPAMLLNADAYIVPCLPPGEACLNATSGSDATDLWHTTPQIIEAERVAQAYGGAGTRDTQPMRITDVVTYAVQPNGIPLVVAKVVTDQPGLHGWGCGLFRPTHADSCPSTRSKRTVRRTS